MKQQIVAINGGTSFDTYEEYIEFLQTRELTLDRLRHFWDWKATLNKELGEEFEVLSPKMPNTTNARYSEWCIWWSRCAQLLQDDVILIGHSLGGIFLAKYLSENDFPTKIKATILVSAPFNDCSTEESLTDFAVPASLDRWARQGGQIYLVHSEDDPVVPFEQLSRYQQALPAAKTLVLPDRAHFNQEKFPELVALLKKLGLGTVSL